MNPVDEYISTFPETTQQLLQQLRTVILENAPGATEEFAYKMPAYKLHGKRLVYFAGYKNHIGFYGFPSSHEVFAKALSKYKGGKGSVQFPLDRPLPLDLIAQMVQFRVQENETKLKK